MRICHEVIRPRIGITLALAVHDGNALLGSDLLGWRRNVSLTGGGRRLRRSLPDAHTVIDGMLERGITPAGRHPGTRFQVRDLDALAALFGQ